MVYSKIRECNAVLFQDLKGLKSSSVGFDARHLSLIKKYIEQINHIVMNRELFFDSNDIKMLSYTAIAQLFDIAKCNRVFDSLTIDSLANNNISCFQFIADGGFSNRIRALVSFDVICSLYGLNEINRVWLPNESCPCEFTDIFTNDKSYGFVSPCDVAESFLVCGDKYVMDEIYSQWVFWETFLKPSGFSWSDFNIKYKEKLDLLFRNVAADIESKVSSIASNFSKSSLGVHIRATDFSNHYKAVYPDRVLPDVDSFVGYINKNFVNIDSIYLASDDPALIESFKKSIAIPVFHNSSTIFSNRLRLTSVSDSVVDLLCLSRCASVLGTYGSSFSELASDIGNINRITI